MLTFKYHIQDREGNLQKSDGKLQEYLELEQAEIQAINWNRIVGRVEYSVVKKDLTPPEESWKLREFNRFKNGEYILPLFLEHYDKKDHFLHLSLREKGLLSYTKTSLNGEKDIQSQISLQGYLEKFYKKQIDQIVIKNLIKRFEEETTENDGFHLVTKPEEIAKVYMDSDARSCMVGSFEGLPYHPTYVYGAGDLAVGYVTNSQNRVIERAICWPEKKLYSRVYGSSRLHDLFKKRGYEKSKYYNNEKDRSLDGARLLSIPIEDNPDIWLMPYIDERDIRAVQFGNKFKLWDYTLNGIPEKSYTVRGGNGATGEYRLKKECAHCRNRDFDLISIYVGEPDEWTHERWCSLCIVADGYRSQYSGYYYSNNLGFTLMEDGSKWHPTEFAKCGFTCSVDGKNYHNSYKVYIYNDKNKISRCVHSKNLLKINTKHCASSGRYYEEDVEFVTIPVYQDHEMIRLSHYLFIKKEFMVNFCIETLDDSAKVIRPPKSVSLPMGPLYATNYLQPIATSTHTISAGHGYWIINGTQR